MRKEHLTPDGWKPCTASKRACKYTHRPAQNMGYLITETAEKTAQGDKGAVSKFFDAVFGKKLSTPVEVPDLAYVHVPAPSADELTLNKIKRTKDGRYHVLSSSGRTGQIVHTFGDLTTNQKAVEALHQADVDKEYQLGECGVLANELWNANPHVEDYYIYKTKDDPNFGIHQFVKLKDGTYADSLGIWSEEAMDASWKQVDPEGRIALIEEEGEVPEKDPSIVPSNRKLFDAITEVINNHMAQKA